MRGGDAQPDEFAAGIGGAYYFFPAGMSVSLAGRIHSRHGVEFARHCGQGELSGKSSLILKNGKNRYLSYAEGVRF